MWPFVRYFSLGFIHVASVGKWRLKYRGGENWRSCCRTETEKMVMVCCVPCTLRGFPGGASGKEPRKHKKGGFDPSVGKIPWRKACQPIPVFLPRESQGQRSPQGRRVGHD